MTIKLDAFIKLMQMTTSSFDNECLTAIRKANAMLAASNNNWEDLLKSRVRADTKEYGSGSAHVSATATEINALFERAFHGTKPGSSFYEFLTNVHEWWQEKSFLTPAQFAAIQKAARK